MLLMVSQDALKNVVWIRWSKGMDFLVACKPDGIHSNIYIHHK